MSRKPSFTRRIDPSLRCGTVAGCGACRSTPAGSGARCPWSRRDRSRAGPGWGTRSPDGRAWCGIPAWAAHPGRPHGLAAQPPLPLGCRCCTCAQPSRATHPSRARQPGGERGGSPAQAVGSGLLPPATADPPHPDACGALERQSSTSRRHVVSASGHQPIHEVRHQVGQPSPGPPTARIGRAAEDRR